jgi:hypothetical protein
VWTGAELRAAIGIRSPDRSARNESIYRLSYTGQQLLVSSAQFLNDSLKPELLQAVVSVRLMAMKWPSSPLCHFRDFRHFA